MTRVQLTCVTALLTAAPILSACGSPSPTLSSAHISCGKHGTFDVVNDVIDITVGPTTYGQAQCTIDYLEFPAGTSKALEDALMTQQDGSAESEGATAQWHYLQPGTLGVTVRGKR